MRKVSKSKSSEAHRRTATAEEEKEPVHHSKWKALSRKGRKSNKSNKKEQRRKTSNKKKRKSARSLPVVFQSCQGAARAIVLERRAQARSLAPARQPSKKPTNETKRQKPKAMVKSSSTLQLFAPVPALFRWPCCLPARNARPKKHACVRQGLTRDQDGERLVRSSG
ncbi:hypothetical protein CAOG_009561 [Capsaspora owczarzaki ATCC 30864]|uniref:Uncharacterized protein n=1 Tax=Capsaspora owczarzaki (strain ATCC 30864) TaxID=595528 RepID=A0A0D2X1U3_CAPO3|nr:hypothetical protein CAOG_009561 [Capsaspora owczarzaki ATCC 30864]